MTKPEATETLESAGDLIRRQDALDTLAEVFREYNIGFEPDKDQRGFASAVPKAIREIPSRS